MSSSFLIFSQSYLWSKLRYLPCGKMEPGEDISEAAKREVVGRFFIVFIYLPIHLFFFSVPFTFILILTALKELFEDIKRHRADRKENSAKTQVYNQSTGKFQEIEWKDINVGDVLKIEDGKSFPADLILVASSEPQGISYIETSNLDGETNLKIRSSVPNTYEKFNQEENLKNFGGELQIELPNRKLYEFNGNISLSEDNGSKEPLKPDYVLLRGAKLGKLQ